MGCFRKNGPTDVRGGRARTTASAARRATNGSVAIASRARRAWWSLLGVLALLLGRRLGLEVLLPFRVGHAVDLLSDAYSRACVIVPPRTDTVRVAVERLFKRYGLPLAIRSDNGAPFAGTGAGGLSRLAAARYHFERQLRQKPARFIRTSTASAAFYRPSLRLLDEPWYDARHAPGAHRRVHQRPSALASRGPAGPRGSQTNYEHCYPCNRSKMRERTRRGRRANQSRASRPPRRTCASARRRLGLEVLVGHRRPAGAPPRDS